MATALDVINRSLRIIGVTAEGETPSAAQAADALDVLNGMVGAWEAQGIRIGLPTLALADTVQVPASHIDPIVYNLALALSTEYAFEPKGSTMAKADEGMAALRNMYARIPVMALEPEYYRHTEAWYRR